MPVLLGGVFKATNNRSPGEANAGMRNKGEYGKLEMQRFIKKHGLKFAFNPNFPVNTLMMMRGAVAAEQLGIFPRLCRRDVPLHVGRAAQDGRSGGRHCDLEGMRL